MANYKYKLPENYIYLYHTDEYFILPQYPEQISDSQSSTFASQNALARTSPIYSYSYSGPRTVQVSLQLHRDMMNDVNTTGSNVKIKGADNSIITSITDDYVDILIKKLQAIALPRYDSGNKSVDPPRVAVRFGDEIFIKGVVQGGVTTTYSGPLLSDNKRAIVGINFTVYETSPFDAESVGQLGSFRDVTSGLKNKLGVR